MLIPLSFTTYYYTSFATIDVMKQKGFTVVELIAAIVVLVIAGTVFYVQKKDLETTNQDSARKTAINAMYYSLEEVYYPSHKGYPRTIDEKTLPSVEPALFKDNKGVAIGDQSSLYRYEPTGCDGDLCKGYTLRADLEREADYVKNSRNN